MLEFFGALDHRHGERAVTLEHRAPVGIDPDVLEVAYGVSRVAPVRDERTAEVEGVTARGEDDLHHIGVDRLGLGDRMAKRAHVDGRIRFHSADEPLDIRGADERFIPLQIDEQIAIDGSGHLHKAIGARRVFRAREHRLPAEGRDGLENPDVVRGDHDAIDPGHAAGPLHHVLDHGFAVNVDKRFPGKAAGGVAGGDDDDGAHGKIWSASDAIATVPDAQDLHLHHDKALAVEAELPRHRFREIDDAITDERPAVVDADGNRAPVLKVRHAHLRGERKGLVGGRAGPWPKLLADRGLPREYEPPLAVVRGDPRLDKADRLVRRHGKILHALDRVGLVFVAAVGGRPASTKDGAEEKDDGEGTHNAVSYQVRPRPARSPLAGGELRRMSDAHMGDLKFLENEARIAPWRLALARRIEAPWFHHFIIGVIVLNAVLLGLETDRDLMASVAGGWLVAADKACLGIFLVELALRLAAYGRHFWRSGWNVFDFLVVIVALVPGAGPWAVLRSLRVLRVLRLLTAIPSLRKVVAAFLHALPGIGGVVLVMAIFLYTSAVLATNLFGADYPEWFGNLAASLFSLFQILTLEGWADMARTIMETHPWAPAFFLPFILIATFTVLNLFIGIIVSTMQELAVEPEPAKNARPADELLARIESDLRELRAAIRQAD